MEDWKIGRLDRGQLITDYVLLITCHLRIYIRRLSLMTKGVDNLDEAIVTLGAAGRACTQVASLLRSQKAFDADKSRDALERALTEVMREFNLR